MYKNFCFTEGANMKPLFQFQQFKSNFAPLKSLITQFTRQC